MTVFRRFAFLSTLATYFLVFIGGLVRVSGAGLGCPDWPKCFGSWIPPLSVHQLPPEIDPATFNVTLAWIEYFNRLTGMVVGLLIAITAVLAIVQYRRIKSILYPSILAAFLVAFQGWQGSQVVASELEPVIVSVHMVLAFIIASLMLYVTQKAYHLESATDTHESDYPSRMRAWVGGLWIAGIVQVVLGTQVREGVEVLAREFPVLTSATWLAKVGLAAELHMILGLAMALVTVFVAYGLHKLSARLSALVRLSIWMMIILVSAQIVIGISFYFVGLPEVLQVFHLWLAALFVGFSLLLFIALRQPAVRSVTRPWKLAPIAMPTAVAVMLVLAFTTIGLAERSRSNIPVIYDVPSFEFTSQSGDQFGLEKMRGKINVVDFIFTRCRGACPPMAVQMGMLYNDYAHSDLVQFVSISVDPDHDTLQVRQQYLRDLGTDDGRWQFLRGDIAEVRALAADGFKVSDDFPGYHSTKFILVDEHGQVRGYYEHSDESDMQRLRHDINVLARKLL